MIIENNSPRAEINFCDDDKKCLESTSELLKSFTNHDVDNFYITENVGHDKFIEYFYEKDFDLTILDLNMPYNWYEIFKSIRKKDPEHPIIIYTAYREDFESEMVERHVTEVEDPLLKVIPKGWDIKTKDKLVPPVEYFATISIAKKLDKLLSSIRGGVNGSIHADTITYLDQVPDKIDNFAKIIKDASEQRHLLDKSISDLKNYLHSRDVWDFYYRKGTELSNLLFLLKKLLFSISPSDLTTDELNLICNTLSYLPSGSDQETLNRTYSSLKGLMRTKGVSIVPPIRDVDNLLKSYDDELWEDE